MRRLLVQVALVACVLLLPVASAQAVDPPTDVLAAYNQGTQTLTVTFNPPLLDGNVTGYTVQMCQDSATCSPNLGTLVDGTASPIVVPVVATDFGCTVEVVSTSTVIGEPSPSDPAPAPPLFVAGCDQIAPANLSVTTSGADGCSTPFTVSASATDGSPPVTFTAAALPTPQPLPYIPSGTPYETVPVTVTATDAVGNFSVAAAVSGHVLDLTRPAAPVLEVTTDPAQQKATFNWDNIADDGAPTLGYHLRTKGPQGTSTQPVTSAPVVKQNLQVDATYEFALAAYDACDDGAWSVRLVRLNDGTPPSMPIVAGPAFNPASHVVTLSWVASSDNIQVDHYVVLRNGVPLGATDATVFTDLVAPEHAQLSYVVRAVDTNGNSTDSAPAPITTPDWTPPTAPVPTITAQGTAATLRWPAAADNVGVVGYDVLRDDKQIASMTASLRTFKDVSASAGMLHSWRVRSRDDAGLSALSGPLTLKIAKQVAAARVLSVRLVGGGSGAARYSLKARTRLLVDLRVVGTLAKAKLRLYLSSGSGRITVWRGTPGSSAPRLRLGSGLARRGFVTIQLSRTLHEGRIRLVLIPSGRVVVVSEGAHKPSMKTG